MVDFTKLCRDIEKIHSVFKEERWLKIISFSIEIEMFWRDKNQSGALYTQMQSQSTESQQLREETQASLLKHSSSIKVKESADAPKFGNERESITASST